MKIAATSLLALAALVGTPLGLHAALWLNKEHPASWSVADWSSTGTLPPAAQSRPAIIRVYAARTGRWKGIFATHSWIVLKEEGASAYQRWDKVGWGRPVRRNYYPPDARWYGNEPQIVFELKGPEAQRLIPKLEAAIAAYAFAEQGDYRIWPGPNSNTFIASALAGVPELGAVLPPTAIGKDYPLDGAWFGRAPSGTGYRISFGGYFGLTIARVEGFEINILGAVIGIDFQRPALKLPGFGWVGV